MKFNHYLWQFSCGSFVYPGFDPNVRQSICLYSLVNNFLYAIRLSFDLLLVPHKATFGRACTTTICALAFKKKTIAFFNRYIFSSFYFVNYTISLYVLFMRFKAIFEILIFLCRTVLLLTLLFINLWTTTYLFRNV